MHVVCVMCMACPARKLISLGPCGVLTVKLNEVIMNEAIINEVIMNEAMVNEAMVNEAMVDEVIMNAEEQAVIHKVGDAVKARMAQLPLFAEAVTA